MSKIEDTEKPVSAANAGTPKIRRKRGKDPEDVKMHLRIPRHLHAECRADASRRGVSLTVVLIERLSAASTAAAKSELTRLVAELARVHGDVVLQRALEALWSVDETERMRHIRDALELVRTAAQDP